MFLKINLDMVAQALEVGEFRGSWEKKKKFSKVYADAMFPEDVSQKGLCETELESVRDEFENAHVWIR